MAASTPVVLSEDIRGVLQSLQQLNVAMEVLCHSLNPCHQDMAHPQLAGAGDGLHLCRVAANILNKQSRTENKGWSFSLEVDRGVNSLTVSYELFTRASDLD